jgi:hypothetical protein
VPLTDKALPPAVELQLVVASPRIGTGQQRYTAVLWHDGRRPEHDVQVVLLHHLLEARAAEVGPRRRQRVEVDHGAPAVGRGRRRLRAAVARSVASCGWELLPSQCAEPSRVVRSHCGGVHGVCLAE